MSQKVSVILIVFLCTFAIAVGVLLAFLNARYPFNTFIPVFLLPDSQRYTPNCCSDLELKQGYRCEPDCGPPVVSFSDRFRRKTYSCLSSKDYASSFFGGTRICPICLSSSTRISTPNGEVNVQDIKVGMVVWTVDKNENKVAAPVVKVSNTQVPKNHYMVHLVLKDGREIDVSPNHPTVNGKMVDQLNIGESYAGSFVAKTTMVPYWDSKTYDLLPSGNTGFYFANGIQIASTLKK